MGSSKNINTAARGKRDSEDNQRAAIGSVGETFGSRGVQSQLRHDDRNEKIVAKHAVIAGVQEV